MKGTIVKVQRDKTFEELISGFNPMWEVEYTAKKNPHAGISKKGTGPGMDSRFFSETKRIPLHPNDIPFAEEGKEVEFEIDRSTPLGMAYGQEQYSGCLVQMFGEGARIVHPTETWEMIKDKILENKHSNMIDWFIEELKKQGYEVPKKKKYER